MQQQQQQQWQQTVAALIEAHLAAYMYGHSIAGSSAVAHTVACVMNAGIVFYLTLARLCRAVLVTSLCEQARQLMLCTCFQEHGEDTNSIFSTLGDKIRGLTRPSKSKAGLATQAERKFSRQNSASR